MKLTPNLFNYLYHYAARSFLKGSVACLWAMASRSKHKLTTHDSYSIPICGLVCATCVAHSTGAVSYTLYIFGPALVPPVQ
jgi:hypothetical protein